VLYFQEKSFVRRLVAMNNGKFRKAPIFSLSFDDWMMVIVVLFAVIFHGD